MNLDQILNSHYNLEQQITILREELARLIEQLSNIDSKIIFFSQKDRLNFLFSSKKINQSLYERLIFFQFKCEFEWFILSDEEKEYVIKTGIQCIQRLFNPDLSQEDQETEEENQKHLEHSAQSFPLTKFFQTKASILSNHENFIEILVEDPQIGIIQLSHSEIRKETSSQITKALASYKNAVPVYLHNLSCENGIWRVGMIVLFPDFLVDVTSIAECYHGHTVAPIRQFIHLFQQRIPSKSILIGSTVNDFLDELVIQPSQEFEDLTLKAFQKYSMELTSLDDLEYDEYCMKIKDHYTNLKKIIDSKFQNKVSNLEWCSLEPSFFSVKYGLQGRLDVLAENSESSKLIIELKSGRPFNANSEGINPSHHAQACLYNMLLESVYSKEVKTEAWILYSGIEREPMRKAVDQPSLREVLMGIRNAMINIYLHLAFTAPEEKTIFDFIRPESFDEAGMFTRRDGMEWLQIYSSLQEYEKAYIKYYSKFICRELIISKCGLHGKVPTQGLASLWQLSPREKVELFSIIPDLKIKEIIIEKSDSPLVILESENYSRINQFRIGDSLILYKQVANGQGMLKNSVYKGTLTEIRSTEYKIRLRGRQFHEDKDSKWALESDHLDRSYLYQFASLMEFAAAPFAYRSKILGIDPPVLNPNIKINPEDSDIIQKCFYSKDYFLLWGPPGSGKTSYFIRQLVDKIMNETNEQILIMAYTNRAVDEICESLESINKDIQYIRIGSRYGTRKDFHQKLYNVITAGISNRESILHFLHKTRIYVGTVASLHGKKELFALKKFDTLIIDEASQILESNLVGILSRFKRFIMIGDHLQLPAVSAQASEDSYITHTELNEMGIQNLTDSLFERLYRNCIKNSWKHAYGILRKQGRMHVDLMKFPSEHFYNNALDIVDSKKNSRQTLSLSSKFKKVSSHSLDAILSTERTIFIPVHSKNELQNSKSNVKEAEVVTEVLQRLSELYTLNQLEWNESTCGIITPFKIQISTINSLIEDKNLGKLAVSVDTVERYQGSARDIIIISTCVNSISQLEQITSINTEGTDRKLNVALTRAKEQIILIGNEEVLRNSSIYSELIDSYHRLEVINI